MSEYQYYEFLAIDRPLTDRQIREVREFSTRAEISSTSFVNEYHWGDFRGDPDRFVGKYFDAMVYFANWGTHRFLIGLPAAEIDVVDWRKYENENSMEIRSGPSKSAPAERILLEFFSETEEFDDDEGEGGGLMASLAGVRAELLAGDLRALYIGWLAGHSQYAEDDEDDAVAESEDEPPPIPAGLGTLTAPQQALAGFLRVDEDLLAAAEHHSPAIATPPVDLERWIAALPPEEKDRALLTMLSRQDPHAVARLQRRYRASSGPNSTGPALSTSDLLGAARETRSTRLAAEREEAARRRARRQAEEAAAREKHLSELTQRQNQTWQEIEQQVGSKQKQAYDQAVKSLLDLREVAVRQQAMERFRSRLAALRETHGAKYTFVERLKKSGLL